MNLQKKVITGAGDAGKPDDDLPLILIGPDQTLVGAPVYQALDDPSSENEWCGCAGGCEHDCDDVRRTMFVIVWIFIAFLVWCLAVLVWWLW